MKKNNGFTLVELLVFIVITALLASTVLLGLGTGLRKYPSIHQQIIATQTARNCMEWFIGQRKLNGYAILSCPSTSTPSFCTVPSGYNLSVNIQCTTLSGDANYKTITVTVSGLGDASFSTLIANY